MIKTVVVCTVLCAAAALVRFHGPIANGAGPNQAIPITAKPTTARFVAVDGSNATQSLSDDKSRWQAPAADASTITLGEAKAGWSDLFNH
ncbi:hypothetical protein [Burkholderia aenigmatica]|uniref:hypothetical protein n=1 Tax=Burkholderia aenigmatica TaxID=2015348 RepID=UPI0011779B19|nr:hypothetical protein [Burkholderia aenigmatica]